MTRKLVEEDQVLCLSGSIGTPTNSGVCSCLNEKKAPQLSPGTGASKWNDPKGHPWTMGFFIDYQAEGYICAAYILKNKPDAKIGALYQNDDFGKDYLKEGVDGLGDKAASMISITQSYETTDPTVDSQIRQLQAAGCAVLITIANPRGASMANATFHSARSCPAGSTDMDRRSRTGPHRSTPLSCSQIADAGSAT
jgi:branched-chain amino acid transport system substrate-binding protein